MAGTTVGTKGTGEVSDHQMRAYTDLIYKVTGIRIPLIKKTLMSNRIRRRLRATEIADYDSYLAHLRGVDQQDPEWDAFLQEITTHETYLFRDEGQWAWFQDVYLPEIVSAAQRGQRTRTLRIWSAAASTGDEAYTIACCVAARLRDLSQWKVTILGTDIGITALEEAQEAVFGERAMRLVPDDMKRKYFNNVLAGKRWQAKESLREMVQLRQHNLLDPIRESAFDVIFLKNVLIYFDKQSKQPVIKNVCDALRPDGYLVSGPAEGISDLLGEMKRLEPWLFCNSRAQNN